MMSSNEGPLMNLRESWYTMLCEIICGTLTIWMGDTDTRDSDTVLFPGGIAMHQ
jgi:hypothetical protein